MYTQEIIRRTEHLTKMAKILKIHLSSAKSKNKMLRVVVWDFRGEEGNSNKNRKVNKCLMGHTETTGHKVDSDL